jgi:hypothetical protein
MSNTVRPRRRKPRWGLVAVFLGIALAAFLFGLYQFSRPNIVRTTHSDGIAAFDDWQNSFGAELEGEPQLTELGDGTVRLTGIYAGTRPIDSVDLQLACDLMDVPPTWELVDCSILPDRPKAFSITIQR